MGLFESQRDETVDRNGPTLASFCWRTYRLAGFTGRLLLPDTAMAIDLSHYNARNELEAGEVVRFDAVGSGLTDSLHCRHAGVIAQWMVYKATGE